MAFVDTSEYEVIQEAKRQEEQDILEDIAREEADCYDEPGYYDE